MNFDDIVLRIIILLALFALLLVIIFLGGLVGQGMGWWHFYEILY